jgi:threonine synthase
VSKWISAEKISGEALVQEGGKTLIRVDIAHKQLGIRRDAGQAVSNGLKTRLKQKDSQSQAADQSKPDLTDEIASAIQRSKLERVQRQNRIEAEEELARQGRYVEAAGARREMARIAEELVRVFEGALPEFATAIAAEFKIEQRDVLHLLRDQFRKVRTKAAGKARQAAAEKPALVSDGVGDPGDA